MESNLITEDKHKNKLEKALEILKTMASKPSGLIGLSIVLFHVVLALLSPYIAPYDYKAISPNTMLLAPSAEHWFGTDSLGRDVFTRTIIINYNIQQSLISFGLLHHSLIYPHVKTSCRKFNFSS